MTYLHLLFSDLSSVAYYDLYMSLLFYQSLACKIHGNLLPHYYLQHRWESKLSKICVHCFLTRFLLDLQSRKQLLVFAAYFQYVTLTVYKYASDFTHVSHVHVRLYSNNYFSLRIFSQGLTKAIPWLISSLVERPLYFPTDFMSGKHRLAFFLMSLHHWIDM